MTTPSKALDNADPMSDNEGKSVRVSVRVSADGDEPVQAREIERGPGGRFKPGNPGGPGRARLPPEARQKLERNVVKAVQAYIDALEATDHARGTCRQATRPSGACQKTSLRPPPRAHL